MTEQQLRAQDARLTQLIEALEDAAREAGNRGEHRTLEMECARDQLEEYIAELRQPAPVRDPELLKIPAAVRFLSCEPLLGRVDLTQVERQGGPGDCTTYFDNPLTGFRATKAGWWTTPDRRIHWVIVGGESGPGARPTGLGYVRDIVIECQHVGVPVFVKQMGARVLSGGSMPERPRDPKGGNMDEWPADLRVREWPEVAHV